MANTLFLKCKAEGVPTPLVIWRKDGKVLQSRANDTNFVHENAAKDDAGNYECIASNSAGSDSYRIEVIIAEVFKKGNNIETTYWSLATDKTTQLCQSYVQHIAPKSSSKKNLFTINILDESCKKVRQLWRVCESTSGLEGAVITPDFSIRA